MQIDIAHVRGLLGHMWGLDRGLTQAEMAEALRFGGHRPAARLRDMEIGRDRITGPVSVAIEAMLEGYRPSHMRLEP